MRKSLPSELEYMLKDIISRRCSSLVDILKKIELGILTEAEKKSLIDVLTEEFCATGLDKDDEPNGRGVLIEDLIDFVNH